MSSLHALDKKKEAAVGSPTRSNVGLSLRNLIQYDDECDDEEEEATYDATRAMHMERERERRRK